MYQTKQLNIKIMKKENELILELTQRLDAAITEKKEMEDNKNKIIKEQLELIKMLHNALNN